MNESDLIHARHIAVDLAVTDLTNSEWTRAKPIQIERYWSGEIAPATRHAEARILWSPKALHVRFICNQTEPLIGSSKPQTDRKTIGLWDRDVCEIYLAPDPEVAERYFELEAAPTGEWLDVAIHWKRGKRESDWEFASDMTTSSQIEKDRVTTAIRIPWNQYIPQPQRGARWRINLFRCVGKDPDRGYLAWQPTKTDKPSFHVPQVFGWLKFV